MCYVLSLGRLAGVRSHAHATIDPATADAVSATPEVKEIFAGETSLPLVNLRYWPKIPGHRDVLQIVREEESSQAS